MTLEIGREYEIEISDLSHEGSGIGRTAEGIVVFIEGALPGEKVLVEIEKQKKNFAMGRLKELIKPSAARVIPKCSLAGQCGGCQLQHSNYKQQLKYKEKLVETTLKKIGKLPDFKMLPIIGMDKPWEYRNKAQFQLGTIDGKKKIGYYSAKTKKLIPVTECLLLDQDFTQIIEVLESSINSNPGKYEFLKNIVLKKSFAQEELMLILVSTRDEGANYQDLAKKLLGKHRISSIYFNFNQNPKSNLGYKYELLSGKEKIVEELNGLSFQISAPAFFQVNKIQTEKLYNKVLEFAELAKTDVVYDLYCGTGSISLFLAGQAKKVYGIEEVKSAIADAKENAELNGIGNVDFRAGRVEELIADLAEEERAGVMVLDPPRQGCDAMVLGVILKERPKRIVYVSCDPATLARDVRVLAEGGYQVLEVQPVDMFPQTAHVETVVLLSRVEK